MKRNLKIANFLSYLPGGFYARYMNATMSPYEKYMGVKPCIDNDCGEVEYFCRDYSGIHEWASEAVLPGTFVVDCGFDENDEFYDNSYIEWNDGSAGKPYKFGLVERENND